MIVTMTQFTLFPLNNNTTFLTKLIVDDEHSVEFSLNVEFTTHYSYYLLSDKNLFFQHVQSTKTLLLNFLTFYSVLPDFHQPQCASFSDISAQTQKIWNQIHYVLLNMCRWLPVVFFMSFQCFDK